jgi:hypothetical protein
LRLRSFHFCDEIALFLRGDGQLAPEVVGVLLDGQSLQVGDVEAEDQHENGANLK